MYITDNEEKIDMKKKLIWMILACAVCVASGCQEKKEPAGQSGKTVVSTGEENNQSIDDNGEIIDPDIESTAISKNALKKVGEEIETISADGEPIQLKVNSAEYSKKFIGKKLGEFEKECLSWCDAKTDEQGNLVDTHIYCWIEVECTNEGDRVMEWLPLSYQMVHVTSDYSLELADETCLDPVYVDGMQDPEQKHDAFTIRLNPKEKRTVLMGYALNEQFVEKRLGYYLSSASIERPTETDYVVEIPK